MKHTLFFVCVFLCAPNLFAADAKQPASIEQSSASGEQCAKELTAFEKACQLLRSDDPMERKAGFYALNGKGYLPRMRLIEHLRLRLMYRGIMPNCLDHDDYNDIDQGRFVFVESEDLCIQLSRPCVRSHAPYIIVGRDSKPTAHDLNHMYVSAQNLPDLHDLDEGDMHKLELMIEDKKKAREEKAERVMQERPCKRARADSTIDHAGPVQIISCPTKGGSVRITVECLPGQAPWYDDVGGPATPK